MSGTDALERKILALERIYNAQRSGLLPHSNILTMDARGKTPEGATLVLQEELTRRGVSLGDFEAAGLDIVHINLWWLEGRSVRFGDRAMGMDGGIRHPAESIDVSKMSS